MTRGQKTLLVVVAVVVLSAGGFAWQWQATAVDRRVSALLDEVRRERPCTLSGESLQVDDSVNCPGGFDFAGGAPTLWLGGIVNRSMEAAGDAEDADFR